MLMKYSLREESTLTDSDFTLKGYPPLYGSFFAYKKSCRKNDCNVYPCPCAGEGVRRTEKDVRVKKAAFTLAETLITLGIIGVVAALTIPNLMAKISEKRYQASYRKAYSTLNQALKSALEDGAIVSTADGGFVSTGANTGKGSIGKNFRALSAYFAGVTTCFENNAKKCWECNGESGQGSVVTSNGKGCINGSYAFIDASGMSYYLYNNDEWPILVDVNGFSGPNVLGKDRYVMYFTNSMNKKMYTDDINVIYPWKDVTVKQRWCPSGNCPNTSRLFGNGGNTYDIDLDNK